jgi:hypothetical protein
VVARSGIVWFMATLERRIPTTRLGSLRVSAACVRRFVVTYCARYRAVRRDNHCG